MSGGEVGKTGVAIDTLADMERLFAGIPLGRVSTSMTINATAAWIFAMFLANAEKQGVPFAELRGHAPERHPQGIHRPEGVDLPARAAHAAHHRPDGLLRRARPPVEHDLDQRLPHPGGRIDGRPGARLHPGRRVRLRRARDPGRARRGRVRPPPVLLLQRPHRLLRGDRQAPGRPPHLGPPHAGALQGQEPPLLALPLPRPDGRLQPDRPAARAQHRPDRPGGPVRGPGRLPEPPHQLDGRGPGPAVGEGGRDRPPDAADHRLRERRAQRHRPPRADRTTSRS